MKPEPRLVEAITAAVRARGGSGFRNGEFSFRCPQVEPHAADDARHRASWNPDKAVWWCLRCRLGGGARDLGRRLGVDRNQPTARARPVPVAPASMTYHSPAFRMCFEAIDALRTGMYHIDDLCCGEIGGLIGGLEDCLGRVRNLGRELARRRRQSEAE